MNKPVEVKGRIWIEVNDIKFIGPGKVQLMELIKEHGSISQAAKAMNLSYRKAWLLIDELNEVADQPVVITQKGGQSGGGAQITAYGEELIVYFKALHQRFCTFLEQEKAAFHKTFST
ncbi:winged helix-turn-helix domain-containing protein [Rhodocytophaga aerolata]|uniref:Winged helix-turn-helix domain-containing protein n=1 Tax=Rhodocytophaga aerolata TaxID=455078 RepID=A0ABT8R0Q9_9BACT|nr:winged helix-turn-helix domain-containing protein [Rhodocytophaga aerolata]MDO1445256.1 winged helix-turn-helix domain-containing protein [Rhodocytophaga aerolata]